MPWQLKLIRSKDRILCWELVSKRGSRWTLHYVKSARAVTDVPDRVSLVSQGLAHFD